MDLVEMNNEKVAQLVIITIYKESYIRNLNDLSKVPLQYSTNIKELELQVLLHGYNILENTLKEYELENGFRIKKYDLKQIS